MLCSNCKSKDATTKKLCPACYSRLRRTGSLAKTNIPTRGKCSVEGCEQPILARGKCNLHYARAQHPLRNMWKSLRSRYPGETQPSWDRFEAFLADVGERPPKHQFRRVDESKPFQVGNVKWLEPVVTARGDYFTSEERAAYAREWTLNRKYKIRYVEYEAHLKAQNGVCGICEDAESFVNAKTKKLQEFSVDHCHSTGTVRGLLCVRCNRMLGYARDDQSILKRAIAYLAKHKITPA